MATIRNPAEGVTRAVLTAPLRPGPSYQSPRTWLGALIADFVLVLFGQLAAGLVVW
jgi:hypothetical protein